MVSFYHFMDSKDIRSMAAAFGAATLLLWATEVTCWEIETVDDGSRRFDSMTEQSLVFDSEGNPHLAYGGDRLYYTWFDGVRWNFEIADDADSVGTWACLVLDDAGCPHVSYRDDGKGNANYAYRSENGWCVTVVGAGTPTSIEVDTDLNPHILYNDSADGYMKYAVFDGSEWSFEVVDTTAAGYGVLELDSESRPHVGYMGSAEFRYAFRGVGGWLIESIGDEQAFCFFGSLELDSSDWPHATWCNAGSVEDEGIIYAFKDETGWHIELIADYVLSSTSLELDDTGYPHVAYEYGGIRYVYMDEAGWHSQVADESYHGRNISLSLDNGGVPSISYLNSQEDQLQYARHGNSGWDVQTIDRYDGYVGLYSTMVLDSSDHACIAYSDMYRGWTVTYSHRGANGWETESIAPDGYYLSIDVDQTDHPHVVFYHWYPSYVADLVYARRDHTGWNIEVAVDEGDNGLYNSLDLDINGRPHVSFIGWLSPGWYLRYATHDGSSWSIENIVLASLWLGSSALQLDTLGVPHIAFQERYPTALKYARIDGTAWIIETVDSDGEVGVNPAIAIDRDGHIHVVYGDGPDYNLKYAYRNAAGWFVEVVDSAGHAGITPSIMVDAACNPHVAYSGDPSGGFEYELRYAFRSFMGWHIEIVDTVGSTGGYSSIALDAQGRPHISYLESNNGDVKYARKSEPIDMILSTALAQGQLILNWAPAVGSEYWLFGAPNHSFFVPGMAPGYDFRVAILPPSITMWEDSAGVGSSLENWTYLVIAVDNDESVLGESNRAGEHDFPTNIR